MPTPDAAPEPPGVKAAPDASRPSSSSIWWTARAIGLHTTLAVVVPAFLALFWWQVQRVRQGNTLSWAYVFEWPFFTGYAVYLWWKLVHDQPDPVADPRSVSGRSTGPEQHGRDDHRLDEGALDEHGLDGEALDEELAAYNRYLAELHSSGRRKRW